MFGGMQWSARSYQLNESWFWMRARKTWYLRIRKKDRELGGESALI